MTLSRSSPNLDQLRGIMARKGGLQRANRFEVYIDNPALGLLDWWCHSVTLPGRSLDGIPDELTAQGGNPRNIPIRRGYGGEPTALLSMYVDQNWDVREYFEKWMDSFNPVGKDRGPGAGVLELSGSYQKLISGSSVSIVFVDTKGDETGNNVKWGMELIEAYPTMIIQEQFSNEMINQFGMLNVSIGFKEYRTKQL